MKDAFILKAIRLLSSVALLFTIVNVNTLCGFCGHQPKVPTEAMRFKK